MCVKGKHLLFQQNSLCCLCTLIAIKETIHGLTWDSKSSAIKNEVAFSVSAWTWQASLWTVSLDEEPSPSENRKLGAKGTRSGSVFDKFLTDYSGVENSVMAGGKGSQLSSCQCSASLLFK
ncbi:hypothetical protein Peur_073340 [Populus x canadensis]